MIRESNSPTSPPASRGGRGPGSVASMTEDLKGRVFNERYALLEKIGAGGMATVYRAKDEVLTARRDQDPEP